MRARARWPSAPEAGSAKGPCTAADPTALTGRERSAAAGRHRPRGRPALSPRGRGGRGGGAARSGGRAGGAGAPAGRSSRVELLDDRSEPGGQRLGHRRARSSSCARPGDRQVRGRRRPASSRTVVDGRTREASRRPTYSSSVPAIASGTIAGSRRRAMIAQPVRNGPIRPGGPLTVPSGIWTKTAAGADDGARRRDVLVDRHAPAPHREQATDPAESHSRHGAVNVDGPLPRNHERGSGGRACIAMNGSIQPRWAAATRK